LPPPARITQRPPQGHQTPAPRPSLQLDAPFVRSAVRCVHRFCGEARRFHAFESPRMCLPQKFVPVTQVGTGRLVPPLNPRGSDSMPAKMGPPARLGPPARMGPPGSSSPAGTAAKPKTVPPVSAKRCQERKAPPRWCHPSVRRAAKMVPPVSSPNVRCHPLIRGA